MWHVSSVSMDETWTAASELWPRQALIRASSSTGTAGAQPRKRHQACSRQQAAGGRPSACQASTRAPQMLVSAVRQQEHTCISTCVVVAHGAAACHSVHPRGLLSIPRPRGTSDATAHQRVRLLLPDKDSSITRGQGSNASAVSVSVSTIAT